MLESWETAPATVPIKEANTALRVACLRSCVVCAAMQVAYVRLPTPPTQWREQEPGKTGPDTLADAVPNEQQLQQPGGPPLTAKQRRQLKRRQELTARALERDAYHIARRACLHLVDKKLTVHGKPLAFDAAMEQVGVGFCDGTGEV